MKSFLTAALATAALTALCVSNAHAALTIPSGVIPPHLSVKTAKYFQAHPEAWSSFVSRLPRRSTGQSPGASRYVATTGGTWTNMLGAPGGLCSPHLLHSGVVLAQVCQSANWWKLTPDSTGSYVNGAWAPIASMPVIGTTQYAPLYYASGVLPDGRLLVEGGEYNGGSLVRTNMGAIYNPKTDAWTAVNPPTGVTQIGDAQSVGLKTGRFMLGTCCDSPTKDFLFTAGTLSWTATGGPAGYQDEQGYELLPNGNILTINVGAAPGTQLYSAASGSWSPGPNTSVTLPDTCGSYEIGPAVVRAGSVVGFGGDTCGTNPDPTSILTGGTWSTGPTIPVTCASNGTTPCTLADAPAALLPNGKILFAASAGYNPPTPPTEFFEMSLKNVISRVADPLEDSSTLPVYAYNFLVLPTGQIMVTDFNTAEVYTPVGANVAAWAPTISSVPSTLTRGSTYTISGTQLSGRSAGAYYGDDSQSFTNFPLVRIVNNRSGQVVYANTRSFSNFSIAAAAPSSFSFTAPLHMNLGAATLYVVANGIPSAGQAITVQ